MATVQDALPLMLTANGGAHICHVISTLQQQCADRIVAMDDDDDEEDDENNLRALKLTGNGGPLRSAGAEGTDGTSTARGGEISGTISRQKGRDGKRGARIQTGAEFAADVAAISWALKTKLGLEPGERVCIAALNCIKYAQWFLAVTAAGGIIAPLNYRWSPEEASAAASVIEPSLLVVDRFCCRRFCSPLRQKCPSIRAAIVMGGEKEQQDEVLDSSRPICKRSSSSDSDGGGSSGGLFDCSPLGSSSELQPLGQLGERRKLLDEAVKPGVNGCLPSSLSWDPHGIALICFTSGTTGVPKAAAISHSALISQSLAKVAVVGYHRNDVFLHCSPLCHIGGISSLLSMLMAGGRNVFSSRFDASRFLSAVRRHRVTAFIAVPAMLADVSNAVADVNQLAVANVSGANQRGGGGSCSRLQTGSGHNASFPSVTTILVGAGAMSARIEQRTAELFPSARILSAFGMTEAASSITFRIHRHPSLPQHVPHAQHGELSTTAAAASLTRTAAAGAGCLQQITEGQGPQKSPFSPRKIINLQREGSVPLHPLHVAARDGPPAGGTCVGHPAPHIELKIVPLENPPRDGKSCKNFREFQEGVIFVRGPNVMAGYWNQRGETAKVLFQDGWLSTGDVGWMDGEGRVWLRGRVKDVVKSGGENVHAAEVEEVLKLHPSVRGAAVVGIPDERLGEKVAALVELNKGWRCSDMDDAIEEHSSEKMYLELSDSKMSLGDSSTNDANSVSERVLQDHCRQHGLSRYKVPRIIMFLDQGRTLPLTSTGKLMKVEVKRNILEMLSRINAMPRSRM